ncbi:MAG: hypothetical protein AAFV53_26550 [Myxococcota bacterium]
MLGLLAMTLAAFCAPPLILAGDVGGAGTRAWLKEGDLLVGTPDAPGRPGVRPLVSEAALVLPDDLTGWTPLGEACAEDPAATAKIDDTDVTAAVSVDPTGKQIVRLQAGELILAERVLARPATICQIVIAQADTLPGPELLILWRLGDNADDLRGVTVFRIPETARY